MPKPRWSFHAIFLCGKGRATAQLTTCLLGFASSRERKKKSCWWLYSTGVSRWEREREREGKGERWRVKEKERKRYKEREMEGKVKIERTQKMEGEGNSERDLVRHSENSKYLRSPPLQHCHNNQTQNIQHLNIQAKYYLHLAWNSMQNGVLFLIMLCNK